MRKSLASRQGSRPERKSPGWLVKRARDGYRNGVVSIRPLAGLLLEDPDDLIEHEEVLTDPADLSFGTSDVSIADDEGLEDSPV
jgi:hypothetical protein